MLKRIEQKWLLDAGLLAVPKNSKEKICLEFKTKLENRFSKW